MKVDKGQMETSIKDGCMEAAAARRADMASVCAKLSCLCHHTSLKVGRICALTSFALKPMEESFNKIGAFYGQGTSCCDKCSKNNKDTKGESSAINPATLYEVERLLNMLRPDYLNPDNTYPHIHVMCRRFLLESMKNAQQVKPGPGCYDAANTQVEGPGRKKPALNKASIVFEALSSQDVLDRQALLAKLRMQNVANLHSNSSSGRALSSHTSSILGGSKTSPVQTNQQQKQFMSQQDMYRNRIQQQAEKQSSAVNIAHTKGPTKQQQAAMLLQQQQQKQQQQQQQKQQQSMQTQQVSQIIQLALKKDPVALQQISKAPAAVVQAIASIMKGSNVRPGSQQLFGPQSSQSLPTVSTLLRPPLSSPSQPQARQQPMPRKYPRPQLYAQPIMVSSAASTNMSLSQGRIHSEPVHVHSSQGSTPRPVPTPAQRQRAENLTMTKAHVQGVRQFMQSQLSALQPDQGILPAAHSLNNSTSSQCMTGGRLKTTVEIAEQAAIAREQKKQHQKQAKLSQHQQAPGFQATRNPPVSAMPPIIGTMNRLEPKLPHQERSLTHQPVRQQPILRQTGSNLFASVESTFHSKQLPSATSQSSVLPSSDELLGSITGIDDTIINDLLKDHGLLANTFPDIEEDLSGEDRGKRGLDAMLSYPLLTAAQTMSRTGAGYQHTQTSSSRASTSGIIASTNQLARSGQSYKSKVESLSASPHSLQLNQQSLASSLPSFSTNQQQQVYGQRGPSVVGAAPSHSVTVQPISSIGPMEQARMDQIKEQMKQEDIPGEMCMDAANNATYRCIICSLAFETLDLLREHVRNVCKPGLQSSSVYTSKIEQDKANSAKAGLETSTVFQCLRCFELCISEAGIKQHRLTCKRVPTVPSDIKKEAAAASASKSKSRSVSSNKHGSVKTECGGSSGSRPHSRNNSSVLSSHSQKVSSGALQSLSAGAGVAVTLGANYPQLVKSEPQSQSIPSPRQSTPITPPSSNTPHRPLSASFSPTASGRPPSHVSTLASSLPSAIGHHTQHSSSISFTHPDMSSPISSFHPPSSQVKPSVIVAHQSSALNLNIKSEILEAPSGPSPNPPNVQTQAVVPKNEFCPQSMPVRESSSPKFSEISGSGGSKFFRCNLCSQTLCSSSSMIDHWKECALKAKSASKKKIQKEKAPAEPLSGHILENVIRVIESVATGSSDQSAGLSAKEHHEDVARLRDPCCPEPSQDTASSADGEGADSEVSWDSRATFDNTTDSEQDKKRCMANHRKGKQRRNSQLEVISERGPSLVAALDNGADERSNHKTEPRLKEGTATEDEEEEDDASLSGSESGSSTVHSAREAPPKLRDRKKLKPIQSFINETFISPYQHVSKRMAKVVEEITVSESTTSGAESDEDHLLCRACQKSFQSHRLLLEHYASNHLQPYTVKIVSDSSSYFCHLCQKSFSTLVLYMQHVPNHSSIIMQKMKAFNKSPRMSLHRERIGNQRGTSKIKKNSLSPKLAKALKSKKTATKSAADRIKKQVLISQGQVPPERLKFMNRRRNNVKTSSEDDYSSDASNLMFREKKPMMIRGSDGKWVKRKRGRPRKDLLPQDLAPEDQVETEESRPTSSPNTADEDYVASEDGNSDVTGSASPPSTRSRKRSVNEDSVSSTVTKRRRHFSDSSSWQHQKKDTFLSDFDTDSNSTTLSISVHDNGSIVPSNAECAKPKPTEEEKIDNLSEENCRKKLGILNKLTVRSLSRRQKERLKSCNLNPSVILDALDLDSASLRNAADGESSSNSEANLSTGKMSIETSKTSNYSKTSTFLDSYLSYLSGYSQPQQNRPSSKLFKSCNRSLSVSLTDLKCEAPELDKTQHPDLSDRETEDRPSSSLSDSSCQFPVRQCSVNLGQKVSLSDYEPEPDQVLEEKESALAALRPGTPVVCLERNKEVENCVSNSSSTTVIETNARRFSEIDLGKNGESDSLVTGLTKNYGVEAVEENLESKLQAVSTDDINRLSAQETDVKVFVPTIMDKGSREESEKFSDVVNVVAKEAVSADSDDSSSSKDTVIDCAPPVTVDRTSSGSSLMADGPEDEVTITPVSPVLSRTPCYDEDKEETEDEVLIYEHSDEEAAQEDLKDMVIVVNNDVGDDDNDEDVVLVKEQISLNSIADLQNKAITDDTKLADPCTKDLQKAGRNNGFRSDQASRILVEGNEKEKTLSSLNSSEQNTEQVDTCSAVGAERQALNEDTDENNSLKPGKQCQLDNNNSGLSAESCKQADLSTAAEPMSAGLDVPINKEAHEQNLKKGIENDLAVFKKDNTEVTDPVNDESGLVKDTTSDRDIEKGQSCVEEKRKENIADRGEGIQVVSSHDKRISSEETQEDPSLNSRPTEESGIMNKRENEADVSDGKNSGSGTGSQDSTDTNGGRGGDTAAKDLGINQGGEVLLTELNQSVSEASQQDCITGSEDKSCFCRNTVESSQTECASIVQQEGEQILAEVTVQNNSVADKQGLCIEEVSTRKSVAEPVGKGMKDEKISSESKNGMNNAGEHYPTSDSVPANHENNLSDTKNVQIKSHVDSMLASASRFCGEQNSPDLSIPAGSIQTQPYGQNETIQGESKDFGNSINFKSRKVSVEELLDVCTGSSEDLDETKLGMLTDNTENKVCTEEVSNDICQQEQKLEVKVGANLNDTSLNKSSETNLLQEVDSSQAKEIAMHGASTQVLRLEGDPAETDIGEKCREISHGVLLDEAQAKQFREQETRSPGVCTERKAELADYKIHRDKRTVKASKKTGVKALKNAHLSLAAFIAERLSTTEPQEQTESESSESPQPESPLPNAATEQAETSEPEQPTDITVDQLEETAKTSPGSPEPTEVIEETPEEQAQIDDAVAVEESNEPCKSDLSQDTASPLGLGLVDYSCSSEENSRDGAAVLDETDKLENQIQAPSCLSQNKPNEIETMAVSAESTVCSSTLVSPGDCKLGEQGIGSDLPGEETTQGIQVINKEDGQIPTGREESKDMKDKQVDSTPPAQPGNDTKQGTEGFYEGDDHLIPTANESLAGSSLCDKPGDTQVLDDDTQGIIEGADRCLGADDEQQREEKGETSEVADSASPVVDGSEDKLMGSDGVQQTERDREVAQVPADPVVNDCGNRLLSVVNVQEREVPGMKAEQSDCAVNNEELVMQNESAGAGTVNSVGEGSPVEENSAETSLLHIGGDTDSVRGNLDVENKPTDDATDKDLTEIRENLDVSGSSDERKSEEPEISDSGSLFDKSCDTPTAKKLVDQVGLHLEDIDRVEDKNISSAASGHNEVESPNQLATKADSSKDTVSDEACAIPSPADPEKLREETNMFSGFSDIRTAKSVRQRAKASQNASTKTAANDPAHRKRTSLEVSSDTDEGDDLSNFELVIEKDTSSRNILSFAEKRRDSPSPASKEDIKIVSSSQNSDDSTDAKTKTNVSGPKQAYNPSPKKVLAGAKSLRKGGSNQFVWEDDFDGDGKDITRMILPAKTVENDSSNAGALPLPKPQKTTLPSEVRHKRKSTDDSVLEAVNRKRKALREKTETAPFTWDLEDSAEKTNGPLNASTLCIEFVPDSVRTRQIGLARESQSSRKKNAKTKLTNEQKGQRPNSLKVVKLPASVKEGRNQVEKGLPELSVLPAAIDTLLGSSALAGKATVDGNKQVQVDEDISFKRDSLPTTPTDSPSMKSLEVITEVTSNSTGRRRRKSGVASSNSSSESTPSPQAIAQNGDIGPKKQASLRSRHSSLESNRSDTSAPSPAHTLSRRGRKIVEPHHKKAGLIKVGSSLANSSQKLTSSPSTRASESPVIKSFNQENQKNGGANSVSGRKQSVGGKSSTPRPRQKTGSNNLSAKSKMSLSASENPLSPSEASTPQSKTSTQRPQTKALKRKSVSAQGFQESAKKTSEVIKSKMTKRSMSEPRKGVGRPKLKLGLAKTKNKAGAPIGKKVKTASSTINKARTVSTSANKTKTPKTKSSSSAALKVKSASSATKIAPSSAKSASSATKTTSPSAKSASSATKTTSPSGKSASSTTKTTSPSAKPASSATKIASSSAKSASTASKTSSSSAKSALSGGHRAKAALSAGHKTKAAAHKAKSVVLGKKSGVTAGRKPNRTANSSSVKLSTKKIVKPKSNSASRKSVAKTAEKKPSHKR